MADSMTWPTLVCMICVLVWVANPAAAAADDPSALLYENKLGLTPPMGWNSWNHFGCGVNEDIIVETAKALVSTGLARAGYSHVNIDDCWSDPKRDSKGNLVSDPSTFPSGIAAVARQVHSLGLNLGIYGDAGHLTCQSRPGSLGYEEQDAHTFASWGVDYLKYDNCHTDGSKPETRYPRMRDALKMSGRAIFFSICEWGQDHPATWASRVGNSWRTTSDITDHWSSVTRIADANNAWAEYAGPGGWNDPDMLEVGNGGLSLSESRSHFSLWSLMKAPLLIGCDVRSISSDSLSILSNREVIAVNQDELGVQGRKVSSNDGMEVWVGPLSKGRTVVLLWNRSPNSATIVAKWTEIGILSGTHVQVRDLWRQKFWEGTYKGQINSWVESHDVVMLVLTPV